MTKTATWSAGAAGPGGGPAYVPSTAGLRERLARQAKCYGQRERTPEAARRKLDRFYRVMESRAIEARP